MDSREGLRGLLEEFGIPYESEISRCLRKYIVLLKKWNARINLTANAEWEGLAPLFREAIWAAGRYPAEARKHLDIGSGAGFPALVLRILIPEMQLEMVESRGKKGAFLETAAFELGLKTTQVHIRRLEAVLENCSPEKLWDCISWKAVKLASRDLIELKSHAHEHTQFWMFHGKEAAVEDPYMLESGFECLECRPLPGQRGSYLSIYRLRK